MKFSKISKKRKIIISIILMLIFIIALANLVNLTRHSSAGRRVDFSKGWTVTYDGQVYENVDLERFRLPRTIRRGDFLTLRNELPWNMSNRNAIIVPLTLSTISVEVQKRIIYGYGSHELAEGEMVGSAVHVIRIPDNSQGKAISIVIRAGEDRAFSYVSGVVLEGTTWGFTDYINYNIYPVIISISLIMGGIVIMIISAFIAARGQSWNRIIHMGIMLFTVGCWNLCVIYAVQLFSLDFKWNTFARYAFGFFSILPVISILSEANVEGRRLEKILQTIIYLYNFAGIVTVLILSTLNIIHICNMRYYFQITGMISIILAALLEIHKCRDQGFIYTARFREGAVFFLFIAAEAARYLMHKVYNFQTPFLRHSFLLYGTLFLVLMMLGSYIYELYVSYLKQAEENTLKRIAFTDGLTGLLNRTFCKEKMEELDSSDKKYYMISFDVDGLKILNDSRGHQEGDRLLRAFADILMKCFGDVGDVIRPGGDEFLVISDDAGKKELESRLLWLPTLEKDAGKTLGFPVRAAYGLAGSDEVKNHSTEKVYNLADQRMYEMKILTKRNKK